MVVEIDDTLWGIAIKGVWLGFHHRESGKIIIKEIPIEHFQREAFSNKSYLTVSKELARIALFRDLGVKITEELHICRGYILSEIVKWAKALGFVCKEKKITGVLQARMEAISRESVNSLPNFSQGKSEPLHSALIKYLLEDLNGRKKYFKTGWKSIKKLLD